MKECKTKKTVTEQCYSPILEKREAEHKRQVDELDCLVQAVEIEMIPKEWQIDNIKKFKYTLYGFGGMLRLELYLTETVKQFDESKRMTVEEAVQLAKPLLTFNRDY